MFDCVFPTRTARFGTALWDCGSLHLKNSEFSTDLSPIDPDCACKICKSYTRAALHSLERESVMCQLITFHNIHYMMVYVCFSIYFCSPEISLPSHFFLFLSLSPSEFNETTARSNKISHSPSFCAKFYEKTIPR
jgi:hypothetical protein